MGNHYKPSSVVFVCFKKDVPVFGLVEDIFSVHGTVYLLVNLLHTEKFNFHFHAYEVKHTSSMHLVPLHSLEDHHTLWIYQTYSQFQTLFVPLKYYVLSDTDQ